TQGLNKLTIISIIIGSLLIISILTIRIIDITTNNPSLKNHINLFFSILIPFILIPSILYAIYGIDKVTIVASAFTWSILITFLLVSIFKSAVVIIFPVSIMLIFAIFPPLFIFATDSFNEISISYLITIESVILTMALM